MEPRELYIAALWSRTGITGGARILPAGSWWNALPADGRRILGPRLGKALEGAGEHVRHLAIWRSYQSEAIPIEVLRLRLLDAAASWGGRRLILVGVELAAALRFKAPPLVWREHLGGLAALLPAPAGINRWYRLAGNAAHARRFVRRALEDEGR